MRDPGGTRRSSPQLLNPSSSHRGPVASYPSVGIAGAIVASATAVVLWTVCYASWWQDLQEGDAFEYGDIARNVWLGRGYVTRSLWPNDLTVGRPPYDYPLHRSPLACLYLVPSIALWGTEPLGMLAPSLVLYAVLAAAVWWLGVRWFGTLAGVCGVLLFLLNYNVLKFALAGLPTLLFAVLVTSLLVVLAKGAGGALPTNDTIATNVKRWAQPTLRLRMTSRKTAAFAGGLLGLCYLTRPNTLAIAAGLTVPFLFAGQRGVRRGLLMLGVAGLTVSPYLMASLAETGSLWANSRKVVLLFNTPSFPGSSVHDYVAPPEPIPFFWQHPAELFHKIRFNVLSLPGSWWSAFRLTGLLFGAIGLCCRCETDPARNLRMFLLAALLGQAACDVFTVSISRFLIPFVPAISLFAGAGLAQTLRSLPGAVDCARRRSMHRVCPRKSDWWAQLSLQAAVAGLVLAVCLRGWWYVPEVLWAEFGPKHHRLIAGVVSDMPFEKDEIVAASAASMIAFYADRRSLALPHRPDQLLQAEDYLGPIPWIVVPGESLRWWQDALQSTPELRVRYQLAKTIQLHGRTIAEIYERSEKLSR